MKLLVAVLALTMVPRGLRAQTAAPHPEDNAGQDMHHDKPPVPPSRSLNVTYAGHTTTFSFADLAALPQTTVHVHNAHTSQDEEYAGPLVSAVLAKAGLAFTPDTEATILHSALLASGTDHYYVVFSLAEAEPAFSHSQVIVAILKSGLPDTAGGTIQLVNSDGARPARWVHGLADLNVMTVTQNH